MNALDRIHEGYVYNRRTAVLSEALAALIPPGCRLLDAGCGDGLISRMILQRRPDVSIEGIDVLVRPETHIPVKHFDGEHFPYSDASFDAVMFVDVLHHTADPRLLLSEAARVSKNSILIKDHTRDGILAGPTLHFMDWVGNARHGVAIPANYWPEKRWRAAFEELRLGVRSWSPKVPLYPWWAAWIFGRTLHFVARLERQ